MCTGRLVLPVVDSIFIFKEWYVASLIGIYKNNGFVCWNLFSHDQAT